MRTLKLVHSNPTPTEAARMHSAAEPGKRTIYRVGNALDGRNMLIKVATLQLVKGGLK